MRIYKTQFKTKCDFLGCKNLADNTICDNDDLNKKLNLCEKCLQEIYSSVAKTITPKSIDAPFKKPKKLC